MVEVEGSVVVEVLVGTVLVIVGGGVIVVGLAEVSGTGGVSFVGGPSSPSLRFVGRP